MLEGDNLEQPKEGATVNVDDKISALSSDFQKKLDEMEQRYKHELSTRDKKIGEYQKELGEKDKQIQAKEQEGLTELERISLQLQQEKESRLRFENDLKLERFRGIATTKLNDAGLSKDYLEFIKLESEESILESVEKLSNIWGMEKQNLATNFAKSNGGNNPTPTGSAPTKSWKDMSMSERTELWNSNKELATQLMNKDTPRR